jgi:hypothetical protein
MKKKSLIMATCVALALALLVSVGIGNAAPVVSPGFEPGATLKGAVHLREFRTSGNVNSGGERFRLGVPITPIASPPHLFWFSCCS